MNQTALTFLLTIIFFLSGCSSSDYNKTANCNTYFFNQDTSTALYDATFRFEELQKETIVLKVTVANELSEGTVYSICIDSKGHAPSERENIGYFYVQANRIYKIDFSQYTNDLDENELMKMGTIVCQEDGNVDILSSDEKGWHEYIFVNEDTIEYHAYNNQVSTGYYETFIWQKDVGLVSYRSGFGALRDAIELSLG